MSDAIHHPSAESSPIRNILQRAGLDPQHVGPSHWLARYWTQPSGCYDAETCCMAVYLPCVLYGKSLWRLEQRAREVDSSDNAWQIRDSFNRNCAMFFVFGLFFPIIPPLMAGLQRTQIRGTYSIDGTVTGDMFLGLMCPVCTLAHNDREIRARESDTRLQNSPRLNGRTFPIQTQPRKHPAMVYVRQNDPPEAISMAVLPDEKRKSKGLDPVSTRKAPEGQADQNIANADQQNGTLADPQTSDLTAKKESVDAVTADKPSVIVTCAYEPKPSSSQKRGDRSYIHDFSDSPVDKSVLLFFEKQANLENQQRQLRQQKADENERVGQEQIDKSLNLATNKSESDTSDTSEGTFEGSISPKQSVSPMQHDGPAGQRVFAEPSEPITIFERTQSKLKPPQCPKITTQHSLGSCAVPNSTPENKTEAGHTLADCVTVPARATSHLDHHLEDCEAASSSQQMSTFQHDLEHCPTAFSTKENKNRSGLALEDCETEPSSPTPLENKEKREGTESPTGKGDELQTQTTPIPDQKRKFLPPGGIRVSGGSSERASVMSTGSSLAVRSLKRISGEDPKAGGANTIWGKMTGLRGST